MIILFVYTPLKSGGLLMEREIISNPNSKEAAGMEGNGDYAVQMRAITKRFGSFCALDRVDLNVRKGTIHAVLGENGAGKSTLMNILYGLYQADGGEIFLNGRKAAVKNPRTAISLGIGMVHQHFMLVGNFTVMQNMILGNENAKGIGVLNRKRSRQTVLDIASKYGLSVDPDAKIEDISVGMQQRVEILKALYRGAELLILDEPTAVLTPQETGELLKILNNLVKDGKTVLIITHKLKEIRKAADVCTIIRKGTCVDTVDVSGVTEEELAAMMVGRAVKLTAEKTTAEPKDVVFEIEDLYVQNERRIDAVKGLSMKIRGGEIFGLAGIDGNGQKELVEAITNLTRTKSGSIKINKTPVQNTSPGFAIRHGIAAIHEDRLRRGLVPKFTVAENMMLTAYKKEPFSRNGILKMRGIAEHAKRLIQEYDIRPDGCERKEAAGLSGGNQQKVIIAREVSGDPELLIAVQPTRGLDVGAIEYVHRTLIRERDKGKAILLISFELDEVMNVSDTIGVIYDGKVTDTFKQGEADENTLGLLMAGGERDGR